MPILNKKIIDKHLQVESGESYNALSFLDKFGSTLKKRPVLTALKKLAGADDGKNSILGVCVCVSVCVCV